MFVPQKGGTTATSNVHNKFYTPPVISCEGAALLRKYKYEVMSKGGPLEKHGGGPNMLWFGVASWAMGGDQKLYETVRKPMPKPERKQGTVKRRASRAVGWRDRRKQSILAGSYVTKTPRRETPKLECAVPGGELVGQRVQVCFAVR